MKKRIKMGIVMDPLEGIHYQTDSSLGFFFEGQKRGWELYYFQPHDLFVESSLPYGQAQIIEVFQNPKKWFEVKSKKTIPLSHLDIVHMRKDPPLNMEYLYLLYILELAKKAGVLVLNDPSSIRDANEKIFPTHFPNICPPTLITKNRSMMEKFKNKHSDIVIKPLDGMAGLSVFRMKKHDENFSAIIETVSHHFTKTCVLQQYLPGITKGDKRIMMIKGKPFDEVLLRVPQKGELRAAIALGGIPKMTSLTQRDLWLCEQISQTLVDKKLWFVGLDVIDGFVTEINVTSPTGPRLIEKMSRAKIFKTFFDHIEAELR